MESVCTYTVREKVRREKSWVVRSEWWEEQKCPKCVWFLMRRAEEAERWACPGRSAVGRACADWTRAAREGDAVDAKQTGFLTRNQGGWWTKESYKVSFLNIVFGVRWRLIVWRIVILNRRSRLKWHIPRAHIWHSVCPRSLAELIKKRVFIFPPDVGFKWTFTLMRTNGFKCYSRHKR